MYNNYPETPLKVPIIPISFFRSTSAIKRSNRLYRRFVRIKRWINRNAKRNFCACLNNDWFYRFLHIIIVCSRKTLCVLRLLLNWRKSAMAIEFNPQKQWVSSRSNEWQGLCIGVHQKAYSADLIQASNLGLESQGLAISSTIIQPPSHVTLPAFASWFSIDTIHPIEK